MKKYDFFVSYSTQDSEVVQSIVNDLESRGLKCWYAPRDVVGRYAKSIVEAIDNSKVFLICLSKNSAMSEHVLNEVEMVYNKMRSSNNDIIIQPLCLENIDMDSSEYDEMMYYIRRINFITPRDFSSPTSIAEEIYSKNKNVLGIKQEDLPREIVEYVYSEGEEERLTLQNELLRSFDQDIYRDILDNKQNVSILDVGCGTVRVLSDRLKDYKGKYRILGVERDGQTIERAKQMHEGKDIVFLQADVEEPEFIDDLLDLMEEQHIDGFDIIHISMFLMYLKDIGKLFRKLKRLLNKDGIFLIKDVDDGLNFAYPDENQHFEKLFKLCSRNKSLGYRKNGRQILHFLLKAGLTDVELKKQGLSTLGMSTEDRSVLFDMYFKPIFLGSQKLAEETPEDVSIIEDAEWARNNYDVARELFLNPEFVFSLGIVIITAAMK